MRWTQKDLADICAKKNISISIQGGEGSTSSASVQQEPPARSPKYRNKKVYLYENGAISQIKDDGLGKLKTIYDSQKEYARHNDLKLLEKAGIITNLKSQVPMMVHPRFVYEKEVVKEITYVADFSYVETTGDGRTVIEDVKGFDNKTSKFVTTKEFKLKWKLLKSKYPEYIFRLY